MNKMDDEQRGIHDLTRLGRLPAEKCDAALGIMLKYGIPVGDMTAHLITHRRGLQSAEYAAAFVLYLRMEGENISLSTGYELWRNLRNKVLDEDERAISPIERLVVRKVTGKEIMLLPNEVPGEIIEPLDFKTYVKEKLSYLQGDKGSDEETIRERIMTDPLKAIRVTRLPIGRREVDEVDADDARANGEYVPSDVPSKIPLSPVVLQKYAPDVTGGAPIIDPTTKK